MLELVLYVLTVAAIYAIVVVPLNLMMGYTGLVSMAPAAFFGIGAYAAAALGTTLGTPFLLAMLIGAVLAGAAAAVVSVPFLRLRDEYFIIATLAFQVIASSVMLNWADVTHGPLGIYGIPKPELFGVVFASYASFAGLVLVFAALAFFASWRIAVSPTGLLLRGIREDDVAVEALGKDVRRAKVHISIYFAMWAAVAGALFAYLVTAIDPTPFTLHESIFLQSLVIVGGSGNLWGSLLGCLVLVPLPEVLRFLQVPSSIGAELRDMLYGLLLVLFMRFRPQGLIGERTAFRRSETVVEPTAARAIEVTGASPRAL